MFLYFRLFVCYHARRRHPTCWRFGFQRRTCGDLPIVIIAFKYFHTCHLFLSIYSGTWGTVCDNGFTDTDAKVVCRQLGHSTSNAKAYTSAHYGRGTGTIWLDHVACDGDESRLSTCTRNSLGINFCDHGDDVGVDCSKLFILHFTSCLFLFTVFVCRFSRYASYIN